MVAFLFSSQFVAKLFFLRYILNCPVYLTIQQAFSYIIFCKETIYIQLKRRRGKTTGLHVLNKNCLTEETDKEPHLTGGHLLYDWGILRGQALT